MSDCMSYDNLSEQKVLDNNECDELLKLQRKCSLESPKLHTNSTTEAEFSLFDTKLNIKTEVKLEEASSRDISLEFIDSANEEKFEQLIKEEKIKTPFKRRHSGNSSIDSRSTSPDDKEDTGYKKNLMDKRRRRGSYSSSTSSSNHIESDPATLLRRQKQIDYGKNTLVYDNYVKTVPISKRSNTDPWTPNKYGKYSRRAFDGLIKLWRKELHCYGSSYIPTEERTKVSKQTTENNIKKESNNDSDNDSDFDW